MRLLTTCGGLPLVLSLLAAMPQTAFAADPTNDRDNIRAGIASAQSAMKDRGTTGTISDTEACYLDAAGQSEPTRLKFCFAFDLAAYRLEKAAVEANNWPLQEFYQPKVFADRVQTALRQSSIPRDDRIPAVTMIRGIVDEVFGASLSSLSKAADKPAETKRPVRPQVEALVFDRAAVAISDPWSIPLWDHVNEMIKQYNRGDPLDASVFVEMERQALHGRAGETVAAWQLGTLTASAAETMTNVVRREDQQRKTAEAEAEFSHRAEQAAVQEAARIEKLGLPKNIVEGTMYFRFTHPFAWLTVRQWLAMVLENPDVKMVTVGQLESDHSPVVSIKRPGQETFSFAFADDGGDIFVRAFGPGEKLMFTKDGNDDFAALTWLQTFAKDPVPASELVPPG